MKDAATLAGSLLPAATAPVRESGIGPGAGMYLFRAILTMAAVFASASTQAQTLVITRAGSRPIGQAPVDNFTGGVRVEP